MFPPPLLFFGKILPKTNNPLMMALLLYYSRGPYRANNVNTVQYCRLNVAQPQYNQRDLESQPISKGVFISTSTGTNM